MSVAAAPSGLDQSSARAEGGKGGDASSPGGAGGVGPNGGAGSNGTSGIIVDNQLSNGGTNIYFTTLAVGSVNGQNCKVTGGVNTPFCAVKLTQSGLQ